MFYASSPPQPYLCPQDELPFRQPAMQYSLFPEYHPPSSDKFTNSAAGETRTVFHPTISSQLHPRRLFTRQNNEGAIRPLNPHLVSSYQHQVYQSSPPFTNVLPHHQWEESSQSWAQNYHQIPLPLKQNEGQVPYPPFPSPSLFPPTRLSPRPLHPAPFHAKGSAQIHRFNLPGNRLAFTESVDLNTGLLLRTPEHPRLRTAQACEKCRVRKAKCSGEHPKCKRCEDRNLDCEYAKEGRVRGPNKPKAKTSGSPGRSEPSSLSKNASTGRPNCRPRTSSTTSSVDLATHPDLPASAGTAFTSTVSGLNAKSTGGRCTRRSSMSLVDGRTSVQGRPSDLVLDSEPNLFRRPNSARSATSLLAGNDYLFLQQEQAQDGSFGTRDACGFMAVDNKPSLSCLRQPQHYDLHGNSLVMQSDCRIIGFPPSPSSGLRQFASGPGGQFQPEHSMAHPIHQSDLVPLGLSDHIACQSDSIQTPDSVFPSCQTFENVIPDRHQQQEADSCLRLNSAISQPNANHPTAPVICTSGGTTSSRGSPLTPTSASSTGVSFLPNISHQSISHLQLPENKYDSVNRSDLPFDIEPPLLAVPPTSDGHITPEPRLVQENHSPPLPEQNHRLGYHPAIDLSILPQNS